MKQQKLPLIVLGIFILSCTVDKKSEHILNQSPAGESTSLPWLYTGPSGRVWLSWIGQTDSLSTLYFSEAGSEGWSKPKVIASSADWFINWADYPMLVSNDSGKFAAAVLEKSGPGKFSYDISVFTSVNNGENWDNKFLLNDDGLEAEHGFVSLLPHNGKILFAWLDGRQTATAEQSADYHEGHHGSMSLRAALTDYTGARTDEWLVDDRTCDCCQTTLWIGDQDPVVFYRDRTEKEVRDLSVSRLEQGGWTQPVSVHHDHWEIKGCPVNGPRSAGSGTNVAVAWYTAAGGEPKVQVSMSSDGAKTFNSPVRIDEGNPNGRVDIVRTGDGNYVISWLEGDELKVLRVDQSGKSGKAITIAKTSSSRASGFPQMTIMKDDLMLFAWTDIADKRVKTKVLKPDLISLN